MQAQGLTLGLKQGEGRRRLSVFGAGYVGLVTAACLARLGHEVLCVDCEPRRLRELRRGFAPFKEPGLDVLLREQMRAGRLRFTDSAPAAVTHGELLFIAVGTPAAPGGGADLTQLLAVADQIAACLPGPRDVVVKSTVPVGSCERVRERIREGLSRRGADWTVGLASNPEFLREGQAVQDFLQPDRVVVGSEDPLLVEALRSLHAPLTCAQRPFLAMDLRSAELCKYAANVMLAARLSLMNELALLAEGLGADIEQVREGVGHDGRIGAQYLRPGCGFGGSCLPKDLQALRCSASGLGQSTPMLDAIAACNDRMVNLLEDRVCEALGSELRGRRIAIWGLAFKPHTDDVRNAPSLRLVRGLCERGAQVLAYDPVAGPAARRELAALPGFQLAASAQGALEQADALLLVTEWPEFSDLPPAILSRCMRQPLVFDGRNALNGARLAEAGLVYRGIGRPPTPARTAWQDVRAEALRAQAPSVFPAWSDRLAPVERAIRMEGAEGAQPSP